MDGCQGLKPLVYVVQGGAVGIEALKMVVGSL